MKGGSIEMRVAVLIDADNVSKDCLVELLQQVAQLGRASIKRAYGDWSTPQLSSWKLELFEHGIVPIQQFSYVKGKGCTDAAMIIDAMDLLYAGKTDLFCLVSSDSDFAPLAVRLRSSGTVVVGVGKKTTPKAFQGACDRFIVTDLPQSEKATKPKTPPQPKAIPIAPQRKTSPKTIQEVPKDLLLAAIKASANDAGWSFLGAVGAQLRKSAPDFSSKTYGHSKLVDLLRTESYLEVQAWAPGNQLFVRPRPADPSPNGT